MEATETVEGEVLPEAPETEQTPATEPEGKEQDTPEPERVEKPLKGVGKRLHQLTSERDYWKSLAQQQQPPKQEAVPEPVKTLKDFEYDEGKYTAYLFEMARSEAVEAARKEASSWRQQQESQTRRQSFETRLGDFADDHPDFYDGWETTPISQPMAEAIESSDMGPEVAYYLKNNQDAALKIFHLPPVLAAKEIGRIEAQLSVEKAKASQKPVSKAPAPAPKLEGVEPGRISVRPDDPESDKAMSDAEWMRARNKQLEGKRKR